MLAATLEARAPRDVVLVAVPDDLPAGARELHLEKQGERVLRRVQGML